jgi:anti-sigma28 factor (negative regulator of flagellin synthesis)
MPTSKKYSKKKAAKKGTKKAAAATSAKVRLNLPIDDERVEAIKRCLAKGSLRITLSKADIGRARLSDPYLYD